jgi:hypothetical protein
MNRIVGYSLGQLAVRIINMISYFEPDNIPIEIFLKLISLRRTRYSYSAEKRRYETKQRIFEALSLLKRYSMVNGTVFSGAISVHRLVQKVIRLNLDDDKDIISDGITLLRKFIKPNPENNNLVRTLLPHAASVWREATQYSELAREFNEFKLSLEEKRKFFEGSIWFNVGQPVDPFVASSTIGSQP